MANFTEISSRYENNSIVQRAASKILFDLLDIQPKDNVLDLGCGTGHITKAIRRKTSGRIVGVDSSAGMIEIAKEKYSNQETVFYNYCAEELDFKNEFEIIFCNSAFQWFKNHKSTLALCNNSLKKNGKMAIQAPAKEDYCPNFTKAIDSVKKNRLTKDIFADFTSPWLFLNTPKEYSKLFEESGFRVQKSWISKVVTSYSLEEAYSIFESGAAAGYLNQKYYSSHISQKYIQKFRTIVKKALEKQVNSANKIDLVFYRIYLLSIKR